MGRLRYHCLSAALLLCALAAKAEEATAVPPCEKDDDDGKSDGQFKHFEDIFLTVIFIILVWISGKIAAAAGAPLEPRDGVDAEDRVVRTPRAAAQLWSLGDFAGERTTAMALATERLQYMYMH